MIGKRKVRQETTRSVIITVAKSSISFTPFWQLSSYSNGPIRFISWKIELSLVTMSRSHANHIPLNSQILS